VHDLRATWRDTERPEAAEPTADDEARAQEAEDTLDLNDRIRDEAPDDLETRRRADQLEREVRGQGRQTRPR
jgi:hypothetical protein